MGKEICHRISMGESLRAICRDEAMPNKTTVIRWLFEDDFQGETMFAEFRNHYEKARITQMHMMAEELLEIADDGSNDYMTRENKNGEEHEVLNAEHVQRSRLRVDTRKWLLSKVLPKVYGDKVMQEITGKDGGPIEVTEKSDMDLAREIAFALDKAAREEETCH